MYEHLTLTHGCSLSNLPLFVAAGADLFKQQGLEVEVPRFTDSSSTMNALISGEAELGTIAFVTPYLDAMSEEPPIVIAGSGLMGIELIAQQPFTRAADLRGRRVGTFRGDPLEVLLHDALEADGVAMDEVDVVLLENYADAVASFERGELDAITLAEPFSSRVAPGRNVLSDGKELWGDPFPDTVLVAGRRVLEERPEVVRAAIRAMLDAETLIAVDHRAAVAHAARHFPGFTLDELVAASLKQPPRVDIRHLRSTFTKRVGSLRSLGWMDPAGVVPDILDFRILEEELAQRGVP